MYSALWLGVKLPCGGIVRVGSHRFPGLFIFMTVNMLKNYCKLCVVHTIGSNECNMSRAMYNSLCVYHVKVKAPWNNWNICICSKMCSPIAFYQSSRHSTASLVSMHTKTITGHYHIYYYSINFFFPVNKWESRKLLSQGNCCVSVLEGWALSLHDECTNSWTLPQSGQCHKCLEKLLFDRM